jgi:hypothetical protein
MIDLDLVLASSVIAAFAATVSAVVLVPSHAVELAGAGPSAWRRSPKRRGVPRQPVRNRAAGVPGGLDTPGSASGLATSTSPSSPSGSRKNTE